jgi:Flp pilus assembly protein TadD
LWRDASGAIGKEKAMKSRIRITGVAALALALGLAAFAQLTKGFSGTVRDMNGKGVPNVTVVLEDLANPSNHYEIKTDKSGYFAYTGLPFSDRGYKITAEVPGLPGFVRTERPKLSELTEVTLDPRKGVGFSGNVTNDQSKPVGGAKITIVNLDDASITRSTKTDGKGNYRQDGLPYSDKGYKITCEIPGEEPKVRTVGVSQIAALDISFGPGTAEAGGSVQLTDAGPAGEAQQLFDLNDYEGALGKANEALAAKGLDEQSTRGVLLIKARCLEELERGDEAIAPYEEVNKLAPGDVNVLGTLAKLYDKKGDAAKAAEYRKKFKEKGGQVTGETYNAGVTALNSGNAQKAVELFALATREDPTDADAHREWSIALAQLGDYKGSIEQLHIYLKMKPDAPDAQQWKDAITALEPLAKQQK